IAGNVRHYVGNLPHCLDGGACTRIVAGPPVFMFGVIVPGKRPRHPLHHAQRFLVMLSSHAPLRLDMKKDVCWNAGKPISLIAACTAAAIACCVSLSITPSPLSFQAMTRAGRTRC